MTAKKFNKKEFIREVKANVKALYRKNLEEATQQQVFQAVSLCGERRRSSRTGWQHRNSL